MAIKISLTRATGLPSVAGEAQYINKTVPFGFSWTTLFFGPLPSFIRKDWFNAFLISAVMMFIMSLEFLMAYILYGNPALPLALGVVVLLRITALIIFAGVINKVYNQRLARTWYVDWKETQRLNPMVDHEELQGKLVHIGYAIAL